MISAPAIAHGPLPPPLHISEAPAEKAQRLADLRAGDWVRDGELWEHEDALDQAQWAVDFFIDVVTRFSNRHRIWNWPADRREAAERYFAARHRHATQIVRERQGLLKLLTGPAWGNA